MSIAALCEERRVFVWVWSRGTGRHSRAEEWMPRGRCVWGERVHCQQHPIYPLSFIQAGLFTFLATHREVHFFNG